MVCSWESRWGDGTCCNFHVTNCYFCLHLWLWIKTFTHISIIVRLVQHFIDLLNSNTVCWTNECPRCRLLILQVNGNWIVGWRFLFKITDVKKITPCNMEITTCLWAFHTYTTVPQNHFFFRQPFQKCIVFWGTHGIYTVWVKKVYTCVIPNHLVSFLCAMCSRFDEQDAFFARVQKSTYAKVCIKWDALHMLFAEAKSHTHARAHNFF